MAIADENPRKLPQRVHRDYLIRESQHFKDHKKGIPEWLKNSDDSYSRHEEFDGYNFSNLPIIIDFEKDSIICLDFGGTEAKDMVENVPYYGDPKAATQGKEMKIKSVGGGHGNGGKYYGIAQFDNCKIINYYNGRLTIMNINKEGDFVELQNKEYEPEKALIDSDVGVNNKGWWQYFKTNRVDIWKAIKAGKLNFFCWKGERLSDKLPLGNRKQMYDLIAEIAVNTQARPVLQNRCVDILLTGELLYHNVKPEQVETDPSFGIKEFVIPNNLGTYKFNTYGTSTLKVKLAKKQLIGDKASANILEILANGRSIAYYDMPSLMMDKGIAKSLIAEIDCPELKEYKCISNDRINLIPNQISDTFLTWCKGKLGEVMEELASKEKKENEERNLEQLSEFLKDITKEISDLLEEDILTYKYKKDGAEIKPVDVSTSEPGYGTTDTVVEKPGGGKRSGGIEIQDGTSETTKAKSVLKILVSNKDDDPLNPGKTYDMIDRQPVLYQRVEDTKYGIWWVNSQKEYVRKLKIGDPASLPFFFFLTKEIIFTHRCRVRYKEQEHFDPDGLEELSFNLIDEIFNRVIPKLGYNLEEKNTSERIIEAIKNRDRFTIPELSEELKIDPVYIHVFFNNNDFLKDNFHMQKIKSKGGRGKATNLYTSKTSQKSNEEGSK